MPDFAKLLGASRGASTLLVLFIDRDDLEIGFPLEKPAKPSRPQGKKRK